MGGDPDYLVVGHLSKPHGTRGEILVWPLTDRPDEVFAPGQRVLLGDEDGDVDVSEPGMVVATSRAYRKGWLVGFEGVSARPAAVELAGRYLLAPASEVPEPGEGEVFYHQLLALEVVTTGGEVVGRVREVYETEPDHLLEVKGEDRVRLIPFSRRIVTAVELEAGRIVIDPPEGLLEL